MISNSLVIDTNLVFSALIPRASKIRDIKDTPFVALSIDLAIPFWTGDKKLKDGLKQKGFHDFYNH